MIFLKLIALLIAAVSISKSYIDFRKKRESLVMFVFWCVVWTAAAVLTLFPQLVDYIARLTSDSSLTLGTVMGLAYVFMLYIVYRVYAKAARIEFTQSELIRKLGLYSEFDRKGKNKKSRR